MTEQRRQLPVPDEQDNCPSCGHPFNPHALFAYADPEDGGVMVCPAPGCSCALTWSVQGRPKPPLPPPDQLAHIQAQTQSPAGADGIGLPPADHGSDRYGYVEVQNAPDFNPEGQWWVDLIAAPCMDCNANVFANYVGTSGADTHIREAWEITIAHDEACPHGPAADKDQ